MISFILSAAGGVVLAWAAVKRWLKARSSNAIEPEFERWASELEHDAYKLMNARIYVAILEARVAKKIGKLPESFDAASFAAIRLGFGIEQAALQQLEARGVIDPKIRAALSGKASSSPPVPVEVLVAPPLETTTTAPASERTEQSPTQSRRVLRWGKVG